VLPAPAVHADFAAFPAFAAEVTSLVSQFNELPAVPRVTSCPDEDLALLVLVDYPHHILDVGVDSCLVVSNGERDPPAWGFAGDGWSLIGELIRASGGYWPLS
jgi:hypothetical protein